MRDRIFDEFGRLHDRAKDIGAVVDARLVESPVEPAGIIERHLHALLAHCIRQLADHIAHGVIVGFVRAGDVAGPQGEAVVVLGGQDHITRVDLAEERGHVGRLPAPQRAVEPGREVIVVEVGAVILVMPFARGAVFKFERVQIPFGVRIVAEPVAHVAALEDLADIAAVGRPGRHRIQPPMDEDAQLRVVIPVRDFVRTDGFKRWFIGHIGYPLRSAKSYSLSQFASFPDRCFRLSWPIIRPRHRATSSRRLPRPSRSSSPPHPAKAERRRPPAR